MAHALNLNACATYANAAQPGIFARLQQALADHRAYRAVHDQLDALSDPGTASAVARGDRLGARSERSVPLPFATGPLRVTARRPSWTSASAPSTGQRPSI